MKSRFSNVDEFLEELATEVHGGQGLDDPFVRLTNVWTPSKLSPNIGLINVVAGYLIRGRLVELEYFVGDYWPGMDTKGNSETMRKAGEAQALVKGRCEALGLDVRGGRYE